MKTWLENAVVYEIYPQSFYDTNGDGIGDLRGIIEKLDYVEGCGFTAIWLHPINKSTFLDAGYDVTDFYQVAERYGTNEDYRELCEKAHARGMKVIFDIVAGHTSVEHPWFKESAKAEQNEYTNRYIWTDSTFDSIDGISGYGERDGQYITNFFWCQPALNYGYANPDPKKSWQLPVTHPDCIATKEELKNIIKFWMEMGTDAFRVDMANSLIKNDWDGSHTVQFWHELRTFMEEINPESILIAEWGEPSKAIGCGFHCDFLIHSEESYISLFRYEPGRNTFREPVGHSYFHKEGKGNINNYLDSYLEELKNIAGKGFIGMVTGNHDMQRLAYGRDMEDVKVAMAFLFTMPGVPFVYYGDEIGMDFIEGLPSKEGGYIRTGARTPMQWNDEKNHGFSTSDTPYLPTDSREGAPTVSDQEKDANSVLSLVKALVQTHKEHPAFWATGEFKVLLAAYPFVYERTDGKETYIIAINPSEREYTYDAPAITKVLHSQNAEIQGNKMILKGVSFVIARVAN